MEIIEFKKENRGNSQLICLTLTCCKDLGKILSQEDFNSRKKNYISFIIYQQILVILEDKSVLDNAVLELAKRIKEKNEQYGPILTISPLDPKFPNFKQISSPNQSRHNPKKITKHPQQIRSQLYFKNQRKGK